MTSSKTTLTDIARELDMSPSTVSRALAGNPRISEATRRNVAETAARLNYHRNGLAASLRRGSSRLIGVQLPYVDRNFFAAVIRGVDEVISPAGYSLIVTQNDNDPTKERSNVEALLRAQIDGMIASLGANTTDYAPYRELRPRGIPLVLFDRVTDVIPASRVSIDDYAGARRLTDHLLDQGYRYPVHLAGPQHLNIYAARLAGFRDAVEARGLPFNPHRQILPAEHTAAGGAAAAEELLTRNDPPDAIFSASDWAATGALRELRRRGVRVPEDVGLAGFANEAFTEFLEPPLTSVDQLSRQIGRHAAELMLESLAAGGRWADRDIVLTPDLIERRSTRRYP